MGNEEIRITGIGTNQPALNENLSKSYDLVRGVPEEPSIWENFSPGTLALTAAFPLFFSSKEFKQVPMNPALSGKELAANKYRMIKANELSALLNRMKIKDPFLNADIISMKNEIKSIQNSGALAKDRLAALNKKYIELIDKNSTWKKSFIQKALAKGAAKSPSFAGELLKGYKTNKIMILFEAAQEIPSIVSAFQTDTSTGMKQLAKSAGRTAAGFGGFIAGTAAGAKVGAILGSVIPGAGTLVGGLIGSVLGFAIGGFTSQLAKMGYDQVIPSEQKLQKDKDIETMLSSTGNTEEVKTALLQEISLCDAYLKETGQVLAQAKAEGDEETAAQVRSQMTIVLDTMNQLNEIYKNKFGESLLSDAGSQSQQQTAAGSTTAEGNTGSTATATANPYSNPSTMTLPASPLINPYNPTGFMGNEFMNYTPQRDWSAMLPGNVANKLFAVG